MGQSQSNIQTSLDLATNRDLPIQVRVDYCNSWGYYDGVIKVSKFIKQYYPRANIVERPIPGYTGCFEIYVNDQLVHSKKNGQGFIRDGEKFILKVKEVAEGKV